MEAGVTAIHPDEPRDVIPRWRDFGATVEGGELDPVPSHDPLVVREPNRVLREPVEAFEATPGLYTAGDLVSRAFVIGAESPSVIAAARYIWEAEDAGTVREIAAQILGLSSATGAPSAPAPFEWDYTVARVRKLKAILSDEPRNAVRWTDLALAHLKLGAVAAARRDIQNALTLAPGNRYVLRSAVRFYTLVDEPETAHRVLTRDRSVLEDPWILAAELATTELLGVSPTSVRAKRRLVESGTHAPWHVSELASQLATTELRAGGLKQAKRTMRKALVDPTENAVAQAEWASRLGMDPPREELLRRPNSFEARALASAQGGRLTQSLEAAKRWQADQPFDPSAATFVSYLAAIGLMDYAEAERAARQGLIANPANGTIRNNLVFALASQGKTAEATKEMTLMPDASAGTREEGTRVATRGLVAFRGGDPVQGRALYREAQRILSRARESDAASLAALMWAREEIHSSAPDSEVVVREAVDLAKNSKADEVHLWLKRIRESAVEAGIFL